MNHEWSYSRKPIGLLQREFEQNILRFFPVFLVEKTINSLEIEYRTYINSTITSFFVRRGHDWRHDIVSEKINSYYPISQSFIRSDAKNPRGFPAAEASEWLVSLGDLPPNPTAHTRSSSVRATLYRDAFEVGAQWFEAGDGPFACIRRNNIVSSVKG